MKLLYITNAINGSGGLERVLAVKASYFADTLGYEVTIAVLNDQHLRPFYTFSDKITFISANVGGGALSYIRQYRQAVRSFVSQADPDIVLVCDDGLKAFFIPAILKTRIPVIYERHVSKLIELPPRAGWKQKTVTRLKWSLMNRLAPKFDAFVVLTQGNVNEWRHLENIRVIANPVPFEPDISADLSRKRVICVGKVSYQKGQDILARVWAKITDRFPEWELHNFGKEDEQVLTRQQLPRNMFLHPPDRHIQQQYPDVSIYVMPSRYEGFGMVLIEAMAFGLPCVAFDCNYGPSDIIDHEKNGLLVPQLDEEAMARSLTRLMEDEDLRHSLSARALEDVKRYRMESVGLLWQGLFEALHRK
ncbi:MAG: hypothetical protein BGO09_12285 [Bacteroidetes bacterium 47-18]|nr:MAG: hypothetical protein BGO09_12285 [Bacteroidetes bacterium 47-18]